MKGLYLKTILIIFLAGAVVSCSNKKYENNIKSLEKRVAALEAKSGGRTTTAGAETQSVSDADVAQMTFENMEYDFGSVNEGEIVEHTYKFTNNSNSVLVISKATATCGCTVPEWPKEPIQPGESGEIKVKFDSKNRKNLQTKYVNINANTKPEVTRLKLTGNVIPSEG
jgi:hypothetical protein